MDVVLSLLLILVTYFVVSAIWFSYWLKNMSINETQDDPTWWERILAAPVVGFFGLIMWIMEE